MPGFGFGYGYTFSRRRGSALSGPNAPAPTIVYGPNYGPLGPKKVIIGVWNQGDIGYCYETDNVAENLPAKWAARGINTWKPGHPDSPLSGRAQQTLAAVKAAGLMMIAAPTWEPEYSARPNPAALDLRSLALGDPYWRDNWIAYQISDEIDLQPFPLATYLGHIDHMAQGGMSKPVLANFTRRAAQPAAAMGSATIHFFEAFNRPELSGLSIDSYEWHLDTTDGNVATAPERRTGPAIWVSPWNNGNLPGWPRFTASVTGLAVHFMRSGPVSPGRSDTGELPVQYPPVAFNDPPNTVLGLAIRPQPMDYAPGDKPTGHYIATGRVDFNANYPRGGQWQPGRSLRNEAWSGFVHGSSSLYLFPQTVGSFTVTGFIDAAALTITAPPPFPVAGALRIAATGSTPIGWIRRDNPQLSGTPGGAGVYALDPAKAAPVTTGSAGAPVSLTLATEARAWGDDTNAENLAELTALIANLNRMQDHPTGGNLLIDSVNGGRRTFTTLRCPEIDADAALYKDDLTRAPARAGYTAGGEAVPDAAGAVPLWEFGWPMGFEGFHMLGDDGARYIYVRALSNGNRPTWFPGFAPLGLPARAFGPFELAGFRREGAGAATEMTGTSGVIRAGVDDGPATWFFIDSAPIIQPEGNSGNTAYAVTVRRGGVLSATQTVTATVSGTGLSPASASDFAGGTFPSEVLSFAPGETSKVFTVNVAGDAAAEQDETFAVTLSAPSGGAALVASGKDQVVCTITNDDAAQAAAFVWLGQSLSAAPTLPGAPAGAVWLNSAETSFVTRAGITMRAFGSGFATNASSFASMPFHGFDNPSFHGVLFELEAGTWEVGFIVVTDGGSGGTVSLIDDPAGAATTRYSRNFPTSVLRANDTDGTAYANAATAVADAVNNLTFVPVTVSNLSGGKGLLQINGTAPFCLVSAVALRRV